MTTTTQAACPYRLRHNDQGYTVVRPTADGGFYVVAGPYPDRAEAEAVALRRWHGGASKRRAA